MVSSNYSILNTLPVGAKGLCTSAPSGRYQSCLKADYESLFNIPRNQLQADSLFPFPY